MDYWSPPEPETVAEMRATEEYSVASASGAGAEAMLTKTSIEARMGNILDIWNLLVGVGGFLVDLRLHTATDKRNPKSQTSSSFPSFATRCWGKNPVNITDLPT